MCPATISSSSEALFACRFACGGLMLTVAFEPNENQPRQSAMASSLNPAARSFAVGESPIFIPSSCFEKQKSLRESRLELMLLRIPAGLDCCSQRLAAGAELPVQRKKLPFRKTGKEQ